jgi:superfamily I DNA/RNA helicase
LGEVADFLHPSQAALVKRDFSGPARVAGSAGTGKTIVALHRAVHLARANAISKVLLTTFSEALTHALEKRLKTLVAGEPDVAARIIVKAIGRVGIDLYADRFGLPNVAATAAIRAWIIEAARNRTGVKFSMQFMQNEWFEIIDPWLVGSVTMARSPGLGERPVSAQTSATRYGRSSGKFAGR